MHYINSNIIIVDSNYFTVFAANMIASLNFKRNLKNIHSTKYGRNSVWIEIMKKIHTSLLKKDILKQGFINFIFHHFLENKHTA